MRKFTESISNDIFEDENKLKFLLTEFGDYNLTYTISYHLQRHWNLEDETGDLYAVRTSDKSFDDLHQQHEYESANKIEGIKGYYKAYIIRFRETYDILTSDRQRNGRVFGIPTQKTYGFMEVAQDVQYKVEGLGHTFALAMRDSEFDIMILEGKHK
jgi:hypothetical protein